MKMKKESRLVSFLHQSIRILFCVYIVAIGLNVIWASMLIINPGSIANNNSTLASTMFKLTPLDSTREFTAKSSDPDAQLELILLGVFEIKTGNRIYNLLFLLGWLLWHGLFLVALNQLRLIFSTITEGNPFVSESTCRIRMMGFCLIASELVRIIVVYIWWFYIKGTLSVPGARISSLNFFIHLDELNLEVIFAGLIIICIAEVFKVGINLREEQELTI